MVENYKKYYMKASKQAIRSLFLEAEKEKIECKGGLNSSDVKGYSAKSNYNIDGLLFALYSFFFSLSL